MTSIVVLSPHSDDGVLSLGASMARWVRSGQRVELVTVFALDPDSDAVVKGWDRRAGFRIEGDAAQARREEDRVACSILGAVPRWLPFGSVDFNRHGSEEDVWRAVHDAIEGAEIVLVPGSPLAHPDHAWLHRVVVERLPSGSRALYAEQPYTSRRRNTPFSAVPTGRRDRVAKWQALRAYRSQLPLLGVRRWGGLARLAWVDERIELPAGHDGLTV